LGIGTLPTVNFKMRSARIENYVPYPVKIPELEGVIAISAGNVHSLALLGDGTVRARGQNKHGQIGEGTFANRDRPLPVPGVRNVVAIAAGGYNSLALLADGTVMEWGAGPVNLNPRPLGRGQRRDDGRRARLRPDDDVGRSAGVDAAR
jgi:hypothetical protein